MDQIVDRLLALPAWLTLILVFLLPALEAAAFPGVLLPSQSAVMAGGVLAYHGSAPIGAVLVAAVLGAVVGPGVGYLVGQRCGALMVARVPEWLVKSADLARAEDLLRRLGGAAVVAARFFVGLRTVVPVLSGTARLPYRRFLAWNALAGTIWGVGWGLAGFAAGDTWQRIGESTGQVAGALLALALVALLVRALVRRRLDDHAGPSAHQPPAPH
ncbi:hypothetical protein AQ490_19960 [Wenjunlia vitaminophila]|uniref:VTT domain-containing protein n=2 Tax=Wenjunlia vitaminophila TaxID=76728 RepID=A0A0T6LTY9_WENVI|nr:DedA family protein [Wenjunlia vitaminophila]KRV49598.1 hypothetical protein AQ490_19960 [Wenjunlia vitaminophila]